MWKAQLITMISMNKPVFVDTGAFIALANKADQFHTAAIASLNRLTMARTPLVTSNFVLDKTYTRIRRKAGLKIAIEFGERLQLSSMKIMTIDPAVEHKAWEIFKNYQDQNFSYTDCTSFALMKSKKIIEVFSFDKDFTIFGFQVVPGIELY